ncbi:TRAF-like protein [Corchorus olitorius]|uniref:TRAF-like protein n=1 Tax=Corchorus olitorius TaxID=93759 RepID=A0A1R3GI28_9ROSI|nr:TRAF-like protein [Corchorus olitorius]
MLDFIGSDKGFVVDDTVVFTVSFNAIKECNISVSAGLRNSIVSKKGDTYIGRYTWKIGNFTRLKDILKKKKMKGVFLKSRKFQIANHEFRLVVYPREVLILKETFRMQDIQESTNNLAYKEGDKKRWLITWKLENFFSLKKILATRKIYSKYFQVDQLELRIGKAFMKLSDVVDANDGFVMGEMVTFVCEILDCCPWFDFAELEVLGDVTATELHETTSSGTCKVSGCTVDISSEIVATGRGHFNVEDNASPERFCGIHDCMENGGNMSEKANYAHHDSSSESESSEGILEFIVNSLKALDDAVTQDPLVSSQGCQYLEKILVLLDEVPKHLLPDLVFLLPKLAYQCKHKVVATALLEQLQKPGAESSMRLPVLEAMCQLHVGIDVWERTCFHASEVVHDLNGEALGSAIRLLFKAASECQHIPQAACIVRQSIDVLVFLVHEECEVARLVLSMITGDIQIANSDRSALQIQLRAREDENIRTEDELQTELAKMRTEKLALLERLDKSEADNLHYKSEIRLERDRFAQEKKELSEQEQAAKREFQHTCSKQQGKLVTLSNEKKFYQDMANDLKVQLSMLKAKNKQELKKLSKEKNVLAERLRNAAEADRKRFDEERRRCTFQVAAQQEAQQSLLDEIQQLKQNLEQVRQEKQEKEDEVARYKTCNDELNMQLNNCQQCIQSLKLSLEKEMLLHAPLYGVGLQDLSMNELEILSGIHEDGLRSIRAIQHSVRSETKSPPPYPTADTLENFDGDVPSSPTSSCFSQQ